MKQYLLAVILALFSSAVLAKNNIRSAIDVANQAVRDAEATQAVRDVQEAARQAKQEIEDLKNKQKTPEELECLAHGEVVRHTINLRKMDFSEEELQTRLFKMYYQDKITIDELKENMILIKSAYGLPQQVIDSEYETERFLKKGYEKCLSNLYEQ